jgi:hypothetical protein
LLVNEKKIISGIVGIKIQKETVVSIGLLVLNANKKIISLYQNTMVC